jgi:hypothetical protein
MRVIKDKVTKLTYSNIKLVKDYYNNFSYSLSRVSAC